MKRYPSITSKLPAAVAIGALLLCWHFACALELVPSFMLPSPGAVLAALISEFPLLMEHAKVTLLEAAYGLGTGIAVAFVFATLMDRFPVLYKAFYPIIVVTQTIPTIAIAPLLVLWMGFEMAPKVTLVALTTFFPITIGLLDGYASADKDSAALLRSMGASRTQIFFHLKLPASLSHFFSGLRVSASYAVVGAVISEWLGGFEGLGVYMTRVKKAYAFDKMFAVIVFITVVSLLLMLAVTVLRKVSMPWEAYEKMDRKERPKMKRRSIFALCLAVCLVLGLCFAVGCADKKESELKDITLCLDWTPNTNHTGFYVAAANGYYEEAGLNVQIVQPPEDGATAMVAAGQAQFGITVQDSLASAFAREEPLPIKAVAALLQHNSSGIISRVGEGMDRPAGLMGNNYATWNSPIELAMMEHVVKADGGDFSKVELIPNNITDEPAALEAHQADSIWVYYGWGAVLAELRGMDFDYFYFKDIDPVLDYYTPVIISGDAFLESEPETAKAFLSATAKGYEYAIENPEEAAQMLIEGDTTGSLNGSEDLVVASQKWMCDQYKAEVEQWGYIDPMRWDGFYTWLTENDLCSVPLAPGTGFTNEYLS